MLAQKKFRTILTVFFSLTLATAVANMFSVWAVTVDSLERVSRTNTSYREYYTDDNFAIKVSNDGQKVLFLSSAPNAHYASSGTAIQAFIKNTSTEEVTLISKSPSGASANTAVDYADMSPDGNFVVYSTGASNILTNDTNGNQDVFHYNVQTGVTTLVSNVNELPDSDSNSFDPQVSDDGRYVVFTSTASNLVAGDTNANDDVFLFDLNTNIVTRVSTDSSDQESDRGGVDPDISGDGAFVVFSSTSTNLVPGDGNSVQDVFLKNLQDNSTTRISVDSDEVESDGVSSMPSISADGNVIAFGSEATNLVASDLNAASDIFVRNITLDTTERVSISDDEVEASGNSDAAKISSDGNKVLIYSNADNLVDNDTNAVSDLFMRNISAGSTDVVSLTYTGAFASTDVDYIHFGFADSGNYAVFTTSNSNIVSPATSTNPHVYLRDIQGSTVTAISRTGLIRTLNNSASEADITDNGRYTVYTSNSTNIVSGDSNGVNDIFLYDRTLDTTSRISMRAGGIQTSGASSQPSISGDGDRIVYQSNDTELVDSDTNAATDIFLYDVSDNNTTRISVSSSGQEASDNSTSPFISGNGRYVLFGSSATDLIDGETDVNGRQDLFLHDTQTGVTTDLTSTYNNVATDGDTYPYGISDDGRYVIAQSDATNFYEDDTNNTTDVFVIDTQLNTITLVSQNALGEIGDNQSLSPSISGDGTTVVFYSFATNLTSDSLPGASNVFKKNLVTSAVEVVNLDVNGDFAAATTESWDPVVSESGRYIAFLSNAELTEQTLTTSQLFVRDTVDDTTTLVSKNSLGVMSDDAPNSPRMSSTGKYIVFYSEASNLVVGTVNYNDNVFRIALDSSFEEDSSEESTLADIIRGFSKDKKCRYDTPPTTTWIKIVPVVQNDTNGVNIEWTQYSADKVNIKIDDGTGSFPWTVEKTVNDGHEFLPRVSTWQMIKITPINSCKTGKSSPPVSYDTYPTGWYND